jgi:single-strand DNA-binding protein
MNVIVLIGNLTKDLELRYTSNDKAVANGTIAVKRAYGEETDFINFVVWGKQAENAAKYLAKGSKVGISGELNIEKVETDQGNRYYTKVNARQVEYLDKKEKQEEQVHDLHTDAPLPTDDGFPF